MAKRKPHEWLLGTQVYPLMQWYAERQTDLMSNLSEWTTWVAEAGLAAVEGFVADEGQLATMWEAVSRAGLKMPSVYQNVRLHEEDWKERADAAVRLAEAAKAVAGARVATINPEPIRWGGGEDKDDAMLRRQAGALRYLYDELSGRGLILAYHTHDAEMRQGARELHHMLVATMDKPMKWCLDTHWVYRGCGNSNVALDDLIRLYGRRTAALHLRQSSGGVWTEVFGEGDVESRSWVKLLREMRFSGPIYLEQAVEAGTPRDMAMPERLKASAAALRSILGEI